MFGFRKKRIEFEDLPPDVQSRLELLEVQTAEGDPPAEVLLHVARAYPGFVPARLNLAHRYLESGNPAAARTTYSAVMKDFPGDPGATAGLATVEAKAGNFAQAERLALEAITAGYAWPPCYTIVAECHERRGDLAAAADWYLRGYRSHPHSWEYLEHHCRLTGQPYAPPEDRGEPPITRRQLDELADFLTEQDGCDHTLRHAERWAALNGVDVIQLYQFLNSYGGFCDCEICLNVTQLVDDDGGIGDPPPW